VTDHDTALVVRAALAALPADQRAAIVLVDVQGYPVAEAAEILGVAEGTIKSRCARGRARMAIALRHLRNGDPEPGRGTEPRPGPGRGPVTDHGGGPVTDHGGGPGSERGEPGGGRASGHSSAGDTGRPGEGNQGAAESVPSGPAAASSPRPSAHDRRDQR
jgi:RNA polymerase sigma-70 factor (ECF subfamily)